MIRHHHFILSLFSALLVITVFSCKPGSNKERDTECKNFLEKADKDLRYGRATSIDQRIDSFYAIENYKTPYCLSLRDMQQSGISMAQEQYDAAQEQAAAAIAKLEQNHIENDYAEEYMQVLNIKGIALQQLGRSREAVACYRKALALATKLNDKCAMEFIYGRMGKIAYEQSYTDLSAGYRKKALQYYLACSDKNIFYVTDYINDLAKSYEAGEMYDSALFYYDSALAFINHNEQALSRINDKDLLISDVYAGKGHTYIVAHSYDSAIVILKRRLKTESPKVAFHNGYLLAHADLVMAYVFKKDYKAAGKELDILKGELMFMPNNDAEVMRSFHYAAKYYYEETGNGVKGKEHADKFFAIADSMMKASQRQEKISRQDIVMQ